MAYIREKFDGTVRVHPHKGNKFLANKIGELLSTYSPDQVLSEIAHQRPSFDIAVRLTQHNGSAHHYAENYGLKAGSKDEDCDSYAALTAKPVEKSV